MTEAIAASGIAAQAFRFLELSPISSFADDSPQAADASDQYDIALHTCLSACDWSFASVYKALAAAVLTDGEVEDPALPHVYALPGELVALREIIPTQTNWRIDRKYLRADASAPLSVRYTAKITDETKLPAIFQTAVSLQLAHLLSGRWLKTQSKRDRIAQMAEQALSRAMKNDAMTASASRYDGFARQGDWLGEVLR